MMFEFFKNLTENYKWIPEAATIIGVLVLLFQRVRTWVWRVIKGIYTWFIFPFKSQDIRSDILSEISGIKTELKKNTEISEKTASDVTMLKEFVGHNGGGGLMDMVGEIKGFQENDFWLRPEPGFICDSEGRNKQVTHAYCSLLGVSTKGDISGIGWKSYTDRDESNSYLADFKEMAVRREIFRGTIELFDINNVTRGNWIVVANPISAEKAKAIRYIGFLYPADEKSRELARNHGWPIAVPS